MTELGTFSFHFFPFSLAYSKLFLNFAFGKSQPTYTEIMKENKIQFTRPLGAFKDSVRAYRAYKQKWQQRVNEELEEREASRRIATAEMNLELV